MTEPRARLGIIEQIWRPIGRLAVYYLVLAAIFWALATANPWFADHLSPKVVIDQGFNTRIEPNADPPIWAGIAALLTMGWALALTLPVIWVYTFARQKKGFQQSLAQTLVFLPVVVAVVVVLVKHSVALAFSLGGIVGAVAFRHRLQDTKDAVYVFVTIAIGLAIGVQAYTVGFAISMFYNLLALFLWATDFARAPAPLAAEIIQRRVRLAKDMTADRQTGDYVAQLDQQLLQSMTPDQLKALADQAIKRTQSITKDLYPDTPVEGRDASLLVVAAGAGLLPDLRRMVENTLERDTKQWRFEGETTENGDVALRYWVRCRKRLPPSALRDVLATVTDSLAEEIRIR